MHGVGWLLPVASLVPTCKQAELNLVHANVDDMIDLSTSAQQDRCRGSASLHCLVFCQSTLLLNLVGRCTTV